MNEAGVSVTRARSDEQNLLAELLELYIDELSVLFPHVTRGADGRYGYAALPQFWTDTNRHPFLIRVSGDVAGFALIGRGSPMFPDSTAFDVAEFFVLARFRRSGVASRAAHAVFDQLVGDWIVRVAEQNSAGLAFWQSAIHAYTRGQIESAKHEWRSSSWRVFKLGTASH